MKQIKQKIILISASLMMALAVLVPVMPVQAQLFDGSIDEACRGISLDESGGRCNEAQATRQVNSAVETGFEIFSFVIGVIAVIMIIIAGIRYITSGGDSATVGAAKNTIIFAIVGLVIAVLAQVIVRFVLTRL